MPDLIWMVVLVILVAATALWLWSTRRGGRPQSHPDEKNPIDIES